MSNERVLVVLKHFIGDAVLATPLIDGLLALELKVGIAAPEPIRSMLRAPFRNVEEVPMVKSHKMGDMTTLVRAIRRGHWDIALLPNRSFRAALAARLAGIRVRVGHSFDSRKLLLTHDLEYDWNKSEIECYTELAKHIGLQLPPLEPKLVATEAEREKGLELLNGATVGLQPGSTHEEKRIPIPIMCEIASQAGAKGRSVVLLGGRDEVKAGEELMSALTVPAVNLIGATDLRGTMGVLSNLELTVGGDTGMMHIAAAVGRPTIAVFGFKPASKWAHQYAPHQFIEAPDGDNRKLTLQPFVAAVDRVLS